MNKVLCGVFASLIIASSGLAGSAAASAQDTGAPAADAQMTNCAQDSSRPQLSEEEKAKREALKEAMKAARDKWAALTDEQKQQVYSLWDQSAALNNQLIDKYVELGVLDQNTAALLKEQMSNFQGKMKESGKMPMLGGSRKGGHCKQENKKSESASSAASQS